MKVWVVHEEVDHEGGTTLAVFSTEEKAKEYQLCLSQKNKLRYRQIECSDFELDVTPGPRWWE